MRFIKSVKQPAPGQPAQGPESGRKSRRASGTSGPVESAQIIRRPGQTLMAKLGSLGEPVRLAGCPPTRFGTGFV